MLASNPPVPTIRTAQRARRERVHFCLVHCHERT